MSKSCLLSTWRKEEPFCMGSGRGTWNMPSSTSVGRCVQFSQRAHSQVSNGDGLKTNSWVLSVLSWSLLAEGGRGGLAVPVQWVHAGVFQAEAVPVAGSGLCQEISDNVLEWGQSWWRVLTGPQRSLMALQLGFLMAQRTWTIWPFGSQRHVHSFLSTEGRQSHRTHTRGTSHPCSTYILFEFLYRSARIQKCFLWTSASISTFFKLLIAAVFVAEWTFTASL